MKAQKEFVGRLLNMLSYGSRFLNPRPPYHSTKQNLEENTLPTKSKKFQKTYKTEKILRILKYNFIDWEFFVDAIQNYEITELYNKSISGKSINLYTILWFPVNKNNLVDYIKTGEFFVLNTTKFPINKDNENI